MKELDSIKGINSPHFSGPIFKEFVFKLNRDISPKNLGDFLEKMNVNLGLSLQTQFSELKSCYLSAVTEMMTMDKIDRSITIISDYLAKNGGN